VEWRVLPPREIENHHAWTEEAAFRFGAFQEWNVQFSLEEMEALRENPYAWGVPSTPPLEPDVWTVMRQFRSDGFHVLSNFDSERLVLACARWSPLAA
jgi:hypothetical protein